MTSKTEPRSYVAVRVHTTVGWIAGKLSMPEGQSLSAHLEHAGTHLRLVEVALPGRLAPLDFFALERSGAILIVAEEPIDAAQGGQADPHTVSCLFEAGMLSGVLAVPRGVRFSDYLSTANGFLPFKDARLRPHNDQAEQRFGVAFVNPRRVIGFSERSDQYAPVEGLESR